MVEVHNEITEQLDQKSISDDNSEQRIAQFLEQEGDSIRREVEQESTGIVTKAMEEYKSRLGRFLEEEARKAREKSELDAKDIIDEALAEKERIFNEAKIMAESQSEEVIEKVKRQVEQNFSTYVNVSKQRVQKIADKYRDDSKKIAEQEAAIIIENVSEQAVQILAEAKERAKKEANEENQREAKRIIESANLEAAEIIAKARQVAEEESEKTANFITTLAQQKASQIIDKTIEKLINGEEGELAWLTAEENNKLKRETSEIFAEVKQEAEQIIKEMIKDTTIPKEIVDVDEKVGDMLETETEVIAQESSEIEELIEREVMPSVPQLEESIPTAEVHKSEKPMDGEEETVGVTVTLEEAMHQGEEVTESILEVAPIEKDEPAHTEVAESKEILVGAKDPKAEEIVSYMVEQDDEPLYVGEVDLKVGVSVGIKIFDKLSNYLASAADIKLVHTVGSAKEGTILTIILDRPIRLLEILSLNIPEADITNGYSIAVKNNRKVRSINIY